MPENSDNAPKGSPLGFAAAMVSPRTPRFRAGGHLGGHTSLCCRPGQRGTTGAPMVLTADLAAYIATLK
jgi:hypothetical protein